MKLEAVAKAVCKSKQLTFVRPPGAGAFKETFHVQGVAGKDFGAQGIPTRFFSARELTASSGR